MAAGNIKILEDLGMILPKDTSKRKARYGRYECYCGNIFTAQVGDVNRGITKSCGCYKTQRIKEANTTHGLMGHVLYRTWCNMMNRCTNEKATNYSYYGGRGIKVCEEWHSVENFIVDMYPTFVPGLTIYRIDVDGDYSKDNCRWVTKTVQSRNTRELMSTNTSGYRGVVFHKQVQKWIAQIGLNNHSTHIGVYSTPREAAEAYNAYILANNLEHTLNVIGDFNE